MKKIVNELRVIQTAFNEPGPDQGREGGREEGRKGERKGGREKGREGGREKGREGEREGGREGDKNGCTLDMKILRQKSENNLLKILAEQTALLSSLIVFCSLNNWS